MNKFEALKDYFGLTTFRKGQENLINHILDSKNTVGIMPTGAGKSLCYQLPAVLFEGITLVVSPLISLMQDQVNALNQLGIRSAYLNSSLTYRQYYKALNNARNNMYKIIYVAPERLLNEEFIDFAKSVNISMVTVDEAHCISQWGHNFRPSYVEIPKFVRSFDQKPIVAAFTATATEQVKNDIIDKLELEDPFTLVTGFDRENLSFKVEKRKDKFNSIFIYVKQRINDCGIIYCSTRKNVEEVCERLNDLGIKATRYHAGLTERERKVNQEAFIYDKKSVMVATNAFGMGIDKSNVSYVIHYNMPKNIESYYQEAGRAGRDGEPAECILYYSGQDVVTNQFLIEKSNEDSEMDDNVRRDIIAKELELLKHMTFYCHTSNCLREYILNYFGEKSENYCGNCSNCNANFVEKDVTIEAQKIISCILRVNQRFGIKTIIDILKGSRNQKLLERRLHKIATYGIMSDISAHEIRDIINYLMLNNYLELTKSQYPVITVTEKAEDILKGNMSINMKVQKSEDKGLAKDKAGDGTVENELFNRLRTLRNKIARQQRMPAYIIFSDAALRNMCKLLPRNHEEFSMVNGVGKRKLELYGNAFLEVIEDYLIDCENG